MPVLRTTNTQAFNPGVLHMSSAIRAVRGLSFTVLAIASCSRGDAGPAAVRTDSAGIEIVASTGTDRLLEWQLEPTVTIASDDPAGAGVFDPNEYALHADTAGRLYLLDRAGDRVIIFGPDGRFVRAVGRSGGGPGEFGFPLAVAVSEDGTISVFDASKHKLVRFGPDGAVLPERDLGSNFFGGTIHSTGDAYVFDYQGRGVGGASSGLYHGTPTGGNVLIESPNAPTKPISLESCGMSFSGMPPLFSPSYRWDAYGNRIALARDAGYDIGLYEGAKLIRRLRREIAPRPATAELAERDLGEGMKVRTEGGMRNCRSDEVVAQRGFASTIPAIGRIAMSPDGSLWVRRGGVRDETLPIDVFGSDGAYDGTLPAETPFPAAFLSNDRIATVVKDELDVGRIVIYTISR